MIPWQHPKPIQATKKGSILVTPEASIYIAETTLCEISEEYTTGLTILKWMLPIVCCYAPSDGSRKEPVGKKSARGSVKGSQQVFQQEI